MAEIVYMPKLSDTMTEGVVAEWHKKVGDEVKSGEVLAEIETDKATMEFESFYDGVLLYIGVEKGKSVPVDVVLAVIGEKGEDFAALLEKEVASKGGDSKKEAVKEVSKEETKSETKADAKPAPVADSKPAVTEAPKASQSTSNDGDRIFASPLAKKVAEEKGIDINLVAGTGDAGRVVKRDVDHYVPYIPAAGNFTQAPVGEESYTEENVSQMRKVIARRLGESKFTAPHFYLTLDIDMDQAIEARKAMNADKNVKISFNDLVLKASAMALRKHPVINSSWRGDTIRRNQHIHIGVAVAVDEGLLVPVIRFADSKGLQQIGAEVKDFAERAKAKKLQPADWEGNTFTISNLGMFGIESFTAIINSPDSCILAVGGIKEVPVVKNGQVVPGNVMKLTLSCDHRVVDGASGAAFLQTLKSYLENPVTMLV
ncbi:MAG: pyruvate dehydrogenase complex dihydrolipoamide acetyltransferase [Crocinitomicaceae bacterium]|nr:pyruvate dehydrogenase complex dihydrolipoamide acetyltransferase [Crocinitomicaceae bacterium]